MSPLVGHSEGFERAPRVTLKVSPLLWSGAIAVALCCGGWGVVFRVVGRGGRQTAIRGFWWFSLLWSGVIEKRQIAACPSRARVAVDEDAADFVGLVGVDDWAVGRSSL